MRNLLVNAYTEAKTLPKGLWIAAVVVPGGLATITVYLAGKAAYYKFKRKQND